MSYSTILVAIGPGDEADVLLDRALGLARKLGAAVSAISVVDVVLPATGMMAGGGMDTGALDVGNQVVLTDALLEGQRGRLRALCERHGLPETQVRVRAGAQAAEILETAREVGADLIIVGHHRHKGLASFFSHTDESVVHRADCDVLAIALDASPT